MSRNIGTTYSIWDRILTGTIVRTFPTCFRPNDSQLLVQSLISCLAVAVQVKKRGWLSGMEMDSYKSRILDGILVQKQNRTSRCLKSHASVSQCLVLNVHIPAYLGSRVKPFFQNIKLFWCVCQSRLVRIRISLSGSFQYIEKYDHNTQ
jgi:hypothetical protein